MSMRPVWKPQSFVLALAISSVFASAWGKPLPGYLDNLPTFWSKLYPDGGQTLYCGTQFKPFDRKVNVEHVYPMSWVTRELGCGSRKQCRRNSRRFNQIEADMHNLYPALKKVNKARAAHPFALIKGERHKFKGCDFELDQRSRRVEPRPDVRGEIARAMLYMSKRYRLPLYRRQKALMLKWHREDAVTQQERVRNRMIRRIQGNGNSFIGR